MHRIVPILILAALPALASAQDADLGGQVFRDHCATCHGLLGRGDGPMTQVLTVQPPDLTSLAAANGGVFPLEQVVRRIDGQEEVLAHGGPMPVFGFILGGQSGVIDTIDGTPLFTTQAVVDVAEWLRGIQQ
jgi:mono/diheme cytochrome c family protein